MNDKTIELINQLAAKFGTTADHLWGVLTRQAYISAISDSIFAILASVAAYVSYRMLKKWHAKKLCEYSDESLGRTFASLGGILLFVVAIIYCVCAVDAISTALLNPEYFALKTIFKK